MIQNNLFVTQNTLVWQPDDTSFYGFYMSTVQKIVTYTLGEHDPGSAQRPGGGWELKEDLPRSTFADDSDI